jgi:hypothetical protein
MAKCPKCSSRKAKRSCPALGTEICPICCGEGRLKTIACPESCSYLQSELYQHRRRKERAASRGRDFLESTRSLFPREELVDFAFKLQADVYYFLRNERKADDATVSRAFGHLCGVLGPVYVPSSSAHPLDRFLEERLADTSRYPESPDLTKADRVRVCRDLGRHVASLGGEGSYRYDELLGSFFDSLDFEADLDYSPMDAQERSPGGTNPQQTASGLVLPSSQEAFRRRGAP